MLCIRRTAFTLAIALTSFFIMTRCAKTENPLSPVTGPTDTYSTRPRKDLIKAKWQELQPTFTNANDSKFIITPNTAAPYTKGSVKSAFLDDGLKMANFIRFLAYLPDDLVLDSELNTVGQYGAVLLVAHGTLTHKPSQPPDMDDGFYSNGYHSTTTANISMGYGTLYGVVRDGYMRDDDTGNMDRVGHRRWILNPPLKKIGFGYAEGDGWSSRYSTMQVFDGSREEDVDYAFVAWPSSNDFPIECFNRNDPWSISFNQDIFSKPSMDSAVVTLTHVNASRTWTLDSADNSVSSTNEYFNVNNSGYGIANCIIFRPDNSATCLAGDTYTVSISGLTTKEGSATNVSYTVRFFSLDEDDTNG